MPAQRQAPEWTASELVSAFLRTAEHSIVPLTTIGVASGNKLFGAAILRKEDLSLVIAATNQETNSPLLVSFPLPLRRAALRRWQLNTPHSTGR